MSVNEERVKRALESLQRRIPQDVGLETVPWDAVKEQALKLFQAKTSLTIKDCLSHLNADELFKIHIEGEKILEEKKHETSKPRRPDSSTGNKIKASSSK